MSDQSLAKVTVVIPTLNEEGSLAVCLASVGDDAGVRVVVSDGGSCDRTVEIASADPKVVVVHGQRGRGPQLNRGAAAADSPLLLFVHADCCLPCGWLPALRDALTDPGVALACFCLHTGPSHPRRAGGMRRSWLRLLDLRSRGLGLPYGDQGFGMRRRVFDELGGFAEIPLMEDFELARRCQQLGRIVRIPLEITTTARRFERQPIRTRLMTASFPLLFRLGVRPHVLARWYGTVR